MALIETDLAASAAGRRLFLQTLASASAATVFAGKAALAATSKPRLGVVTGVTGPGGPERAIAKVHAFGFKTCQVGVGMSPPGIIEPLREALAKYGVEATAVMTLGEGKMVWDFYHGPSTIGIIPPATRKARIEALKRASDLGKKLNIEAVHTHCGFIPENPNEPLYQEAVGAIHDVASYCKANGQTFMMETGQETPITLLRAIEDVGLSNVRVNLDTANLILYDNGEPVGALDVIGKYVHGLHAKDGLYPTDPKKLGEEVAIGSGRVDFPAVIQGLKKLNFTGPITIEREISGPKQEADIRASKKFLENLIDRTYGAT
jgi:sugar phosphate isomerase/epimerase